MAWDGARRQTPSGFLVDPSRGTRTTLPLALPKASSTKASASSSGIRLITRASIFLRQERQYLGEVGGSPG